jgi:hypothetical protein
LPNHTRTHIHTHTERERGGKRERKRVLKRLDRERDVYKCIAWATQSKHSLAGRVSPTNIAVSQQRVTP